MEKETGITRSRDIIFPKKENCLSEKKGCGKRIADKIHAGMYRTCGEGTTICQDCEVNKLSEEQKEIVVKAQKLLRENNILIWLYTDLTYNAGEPY